MAVVDDLGAQGASGVLEVKGDPSGAIYLDAGHIAFAGASWVPGLVPRLSGLRPSPAGLQRLLAGGTPRTPPSRRWRCSGLPDGGRAARAIRSIVIDAFLVLVVPLPENSYVADIQFTSARTTATRCSPGLTSTRCAGRPRAGGPDGQVRPRPDHLGGAARPQAPGGGADQGAVGGRQPDHRARVRARTRAAARDRPGRYDRVPGQPHPGRACARRSGSGSVAAGAGAAGRRPSPGPTTRHRR